MTAFDPAGPLPTGTQVIQASAGTGKTHAIVGLAVRYIADGVDVSQLMLVTFSRAATQELRDRARTRLRVCADALTDIAGARRSSDAVIAALANATDAEVELRRRRPAAGTVGVRRGHDRDHPLVLPTDARRHRAGRRLRA